ncbi:MAG TPA: DUF1579 family protein [Caulobacter sp.]|nr:DUF1579 family protein [Caulobacter sp.]
MYRGLKATAVLVMLVATGARAEPVNDVQHAALARLAGHWNVSQTYWTDPGAKPVVDPGEADFAMVLQGRHLRQTLRIASKEKPFEGLGYIGYDTAAKTFFSTWMDVNFTGFIVAKGDYDPTARRYTFVGAVPDPARPGATAPLREVMTVQDEDHFTYDYFETREGREFQAVRLEYARVR